MVLSPQDKGTSKSKSPLFHIKLKVNETNSEDSLLSDDKKKNSNKLKEEKKDWLLDLLDVVVHSIKMLKLKQFIKMLALNIYF